MAETAQPEGIHILGIAGTFMAGIASLAQEAGIPVSGSDARVYPPMSTLLEQLDIEIKEGYQDTAILENKTIVIGNALSRGNPAVEHVLNHKLPYLSGPGWLYQHVLRKKNVLAVAGTHGKTTTSSLLAWILHAISRDRTPGFLIGGKPGNFDRSAQLGDSQFFVVEADEYDTAFFDKRSKFVHYHPDVAILNNLEYDHADIFPDISTIKTQFHHLVRTVPQNGRLIVNADDPNLADVINMGCWTPIEYFSLVQRSAAWYADAKDATCKRFVIHHREQSEEVEWQGIGEHNMRNALAAVAAACQTGVSLRDACQALSDFRFPNKRLQQHSSKSGFILYEDFAHHPTAIRETLNSLRKAYPGRRLIALLELRSNTMQMGIHRETLGPALAQANVACVVHPLDQTWTLPNQAHPDLQQVTSSTACLDLIRERLHQDDIVVAMSNGDFDGIIDALREL